VRWIPLVAVVAACSYKSELRVAPNALEHAAPSLRAGLPVVLATWDRIPVTLEPDQLVRIETKAGAFDVALADVVRDCSPHDDDPTRLCELHDVRSVVVGTHRVRRPGPESVGGTILAGTITLAMGGLVACTAECGKPYNYVSGGIVVAAFAGFFALLADSKLH